MSNYTPGPWKVCDDWYNIYAPETDTAITNSEHPCYPDMPETEANARLIAAAPELLETLKNLVDFAEAQFATSVNLWEVNEAKAVIAKAEGANR